MHHSEPMDLGAQFPLTARGGATCHARKWTHNRTVCRHLLPG